MRTYFCLWGASRHESIEVMSHVTTGYHTIDMMRGNPVHVKKKYVRILSAECRQ